MEILKRLGLLLLPRSFCVLSDMITLIGRPGVRFVRVTALKKKKPSIDCELRLLVLCGFSQIRSIGIGGAHKAPRVHLALLHFFFGDASCASPASLVVFSRLARARAQEDCDRDFFMTPEEALDYGLIDQVVSTKTSHIPKPMMPSLEEIY